MAWTQHAKLTRIIWFLHTNFRKKGQQDKKMLSILWVENMGAFHHFEKMLQLNEMTAKCRVGSNEATYIHVIFKLTMNEQCCRKKPQSYGIWKVHEIDRMHNIPWAIFYLKGMNRIAFESVVCYQRACSMHMHVQTVVVAHFSSCHAQL